MLQAWDEVVQVVSRVCVQDASLCMPTPIDFVAANAVFHVCMYMEPPLGAEPASHHVSLHWCQVAGVRWPVCGNAVSSERRLPTCWRVCVGQVGMLIGNVACEVMEADPR